MTGSVYAEVVGDPVAHSKSPAIHNFWLDKLGLPGEYRMTRIPLGGLRAHLGKRKTDPRWRGCNVTIPLKTEAAAIAGDPGGACASLGAVNCIVRTSLRCLVGTNTDLAGIEVALAGIALKGAKVCVIGGGGAARALICMLGRARADEIVVIVRDPAKAAGLRTLLAPDFKGGMRLAGLAVAGEAMAGAALVANATPMGMTGKDPMPETLFDALDGAAAGAAVFDMVYEPLRTSLLVAAERRELKTIDGLDMLIGQAAPAFGYFFGAPAPREHDEELRALLTK